MREKERKISDGTATVVVKDSELSKLRSNSQFYQWLKSEGFVSSGKGFYDGVDWIFININSKIMTPGMPGIRITEPFGHHAVTIQEFKTIYEIFKKYKGYGPLFFVNEI